MKILSINKGWATNSSSYSTIFKGTIKKYIGSRWPSESHKLDFSKRGKQTMYIPCSNKKDTTVTFDAWIQDNDHKTQQYVFAYQLSKFQKQSLNAYNEFYNKILNDKLTIPINNMQLKNLRDEKVVKELKSYKNKDKLKIQRYYVNSIEENNGELPLYGLLHNINIIKNIGADKIVVDERYLDILHKMSQCEKYENRYIGDINVYDVEEFLGFEVNVSSIESYRLKRWLETSNAEFDKVYKELTSLQNKVEKSIIKQCEVHNNSCISYEKYYKDKELFAKYLEDSLISNPFGECLEDEDKFSPENIKQRKMKKWNEVYHQDDFLVITSCYLYNN